MRNANLRIASALVLLAGVVVATDGPAPTSGLEPDGAPARAEDGPGVPEPIVWPTPSLARGPLLVQSAEERHLRVVVVTRGLERLAREMQKHQG